MSPDAVVLPFGGHTPSVSETSWVAPGATLVGQVTLADGASVFYGAVVRADADAIVVGEDSNVQDNVSIHADSGVPTTIGRRVSIGHNAVLHGCTVEDDCLIGMSATVLNGAVIGRGSLVAAGTVVLEGTVVPPGSLVAGIPGKVRRALVDLEIDGIRRNAEHYTELRKQHRAAWSEAGAPNVSDAPAFSLDSESDRP
ncbi:gamma carbonic anhydrase family protein [Frondihabitans cladoniiphilus]|uniref:Gamma carbonic anhydrase family protein n=1 Tax=Frondihabitans cladoniiphilus TaxID=715785 RepID=A0ABP8VJB7_9MICO